MEPIILASSSPRRQEIFKQLNIPFKVMASDFEETKPDNISLQEAPEYFAAQKVRSVVRMFPANQQVGWIFGADTSIIFNNKMYGKPRDAEEAKSFLQTFSGQQHEVISGIALFNGELQYLETKTSKNLVTFKKLSEKELDWYINTGEWHGVAGGYRIQGLAQCFISKIEGSYSSIMGLPISEFYDIISEQGYDFIQ
ncbi:MAG: septum formation protein Maf [Treponema sp. CETP13]|nr:MAG: septum formation protein Maf [Treponema sp. CETP13]